MDKEVVIISILFKNWFLPIAVILLILLVALRIQLIHRTSPMIVVEKDASTYRTAIVFGAGINRDLQPTKVLKDRLDKTIQLYEQGQLDHIILSGGEARMSNESIIMRNYLVNKGIPEDILSVDEGGVSTYDTLQRAQSSFNVQQAVLITQRFHLPRALASAEMLGMDVIGIPADTQKFRFNSLLWWNFRELFAWVWTLIKTSR